MTFDHDGHQHDDGRNGYWQQWLQPPTVITLIVAAATVYGSQVIQGERLQAMRARVEAIERDYQRRDVIAEQLRAIDSRLYAIEESLSGGRTQMNGRGSSR